MMKILIVAVVQAMISQKTVSCTGSYHVCDKAHHDDTAGLSGTVDVKGNCRLSLTGLVGTKRLSIFGAGMSPLCDESAKFTIDRESYCVNSSLNTLININGSEVVITAEEVQPFKIQYYHGKL